MDTSRSQKAEGAVRGAGGGGGSANFKGSDNIVRIPWRISYRE